MRKLLAISTMVVLCSAGGFGLTGVHAIDSVAQMPSGPTGNGAVDAKKAWFDHAIGDILADPDAPTDQSLRPGVPTSGR